MPNHHPTSVKYFSQATSTFIIRCPRAHFRVLWAALTYMTHLPQDLSNSSSGPYSHPHPQHSRHQHQNHPGNRSYGGSRGTGTGAAQRAGGGACAACACVMRVVRVSGTIRKSEQEAIARARAQILDVKRQQARALEAATTTMAKGRRAPAEADDSKNASGQEKTAKSEEMHLPPPSNAKIKAERRDNGSMSESESANGMAAADAIEAIFADTEMGDGRDLLKMVGEGSSEEDEEDGEDDEDD
jgi:Rpp14/Pop5 family